MQSTERNSGQDTAYGEVIRSGSVEIRPAEFLAVAGGKTLMLSSTELALLAALARREGRVIPREELYRTVWDGPMRSDDRSVDVYVHKLRIKLSKALPGWRFIHTHFGLGYRFQQERSQPFHDSATSR